jgi:FkbM family methyltransferase
MDLSSFDWGWMDEPTDVYFISAIDGEHIPMGKYHKDSIIEEIFNERIYEKVFQVEEGDTVVDVGASVGPFTYSILPNHPSRVFCIEPSNREFETLKKNLPHPNVTLVNKGISTMDSIVKSDMLFGGESEMEGITFESFLKENNIDVIDFMKTDCEGGEYDIFTIDNFSLLKDTLRKVVGEWHLETPELKQKFREFRDVFLRLFPNHEVYSVDGVDIKWDLWNEHFIEYYKEVIIYIDNR